jgi:hypothetical protein
LVRLAHAYLARALEPSPITLLIRSTSLIYILIKPDYFESN